MKKRYASLDTMWSRAYSNSSRVGSTSTLLDLSWFEVAGDLDLAGDQPPRRLAPTFGGLLILEVCVYALVVLVYWIRAGILVHSTHQRKETLQACMSLAFSTCYLLVGVLMPLWSHVIAQSRPVVCIFAHRENYKEDSNVSGVRRLMCVGRFMDPICNVLALVAPIHVCILLKYSYHQQAAILYHVDLDTFRLCIFTSSVIGIVGMLVFSSGRAAEVVVNSSMVAIDGFISEIKTKAPGDWNYIMKHHWYLNKALADVWDVTCAGGLWAMRITVLFLASFAFGAYSLYQEDKPLRYALIVAGVLLAASGVALLLQLAMITYLCQCRRAGANTVAAVLDKIVAVQDSVPSQPHTDPELQRLLEQADRPSVEDEPCCFPRSQPAVGTQKKMSAQQEIIIRTNTSLELLSEMQLRLFQMERPFSQMQHQHIIAYFSGTAMGVRLCGILVTFELVFMIATRTLIYAPIALVTVGQLLHPQPS